MATTAPRTATPAQPHGTGRTATGLPRYAVEVRREGRLDWEYVTSYTTTKAAAERLHREAEHPTRSAHYGGDARVADLVTGEPVTNSRPVLPTTGWPTA